MGIAWRRLKHWNQECQFNERIFAFQDSLDNVSEWVTRFSRTSAVMTLCKVLSCHTWKALLLAFSELRVIKATTCSPGVLQNEETAGSTPSPLGLGGRQGGTVRVPSFRRRPPIAVL
ncbi:hypothetical protein CSUI_002230 [Cystoisospora suis]|uniref:Uncharacterized protein n=1 Tax=Cystoisospora suis TaxID=483139 RepID=A0A2C6L7A3_9APIC|nr:hypothetical protein CSUI_002230 [Cystoisospora suis]